jgi:hypothetical protein
LFCGRGLSVKKEKTVLVIKHRSKSTEGLSKEQREKSQSEKQILEVSSNVQLMKVQPTKKDCLSGWSLPEKVLLM